MLFGSGVMSQELFVTPDDMNSAKWDLVAAAAKWAQTRAPLLVDSHWVGGDPAQQAIYGYASYMPTSTKDAASELFSEGGSGGGGKREVEEEEERGTDR